MTSTNRNESRLARAKARHRAKSLTAAERYRDRVADVGLLMGMLKEEVAQHAANAAVEGTDWGHIGDLGKVRELLIEAVSFLAQQEPTFVEKRLRNARER